MEQYNDVLLVDDINYILNSQDVMRAKNQIDQKTTGVVYFNISLPDTIKSIINDKIGLDLTNINRIPMRWIKGDTTPHVDVGHSDFDNTYLIYLVDSIGDFVIDNQNYPISKGTAYKFSEGLNHETINTGFEPRLILGPMSEDGCVVGAYPTIYIRQSGSDIQYRNDGEEWQNVSFPMTLYSYNVYFTTDITITSVDQYFICQTTNMTIGSRILNEDGSRPVITIDNVTNYPGLINNGSFENNGYNDVNVFNLEVRSINDSTLSSDGGWIGQAYFGRQSQNNFIVNCLSDGPIIDAGGGIIGGYCCHGIGEGNTASLTIIGCSSSGNMGTYSGGIIGFYAGSNGGNVSCKSCWSTGSIGDNAGGIVGYGAGSNEGPGGYVSVIDCYTTGIISGTDAGGIFGALSGAGSEIRIENCYTTGTISGTNAGGICGDNTAIYDGIASVINCYTSGALISGMSNGIYSGGLDTNKTAVNFYVADNNWNSTTANSNLTGTPSPTVGSAWVYNGINQPYQLYNMGYSPYTRTNIIITDSPELVRSYEVTLEAGESSESAIISGRSYTILSVSESSITINSTTGIINTTSLTPSDTYTVYIRNSGSYNVTTVSLTVTYSGPIPCLLEDTMVLTPGGYINIKELKENDKVITSNNRIVKITQIFKTIARGNGDTYPCIIPKNGISKNYPPSDLKISQNHLIRYYDKWICPIDFFKQDTSYNIIKYYHIKLENYLTDDLIINDGVVVESYSTNDLDTVRRFARRFRNTLH